MKNLPDYIYNEPPRVLVLLGVSLDAFQCLTAQVEKLKMPTKANKKLRKSVSMPKVLEDRQNWA